MVVPLEICVAAIEGDGARVLAWLDADVSERRDVNDVDESGSKLLLSCHGRHGLNDGHLALARELISRGADVNLSHMSGMDSLESMGILPRIILGQNLASLATLAERELHGERVHDYILLLLSGGLVLKSSALPGQSEFSATSDLGVAFLGFRNYPRASLKICSTILRAGASLDSVWNGRSAEYSIRTLGSMYGSGSAQTRYYYDACARLVADVRAAGGTWTAYRRQSRKDVLRLRSLVLRGRTKDAADPIITRVLRLPNEMCWHVLKFWRATSAATGEVI